MDNIVEAIKMLFNPVNLIAGVFVVAVTYRILKKIFDKETK